MAHRHRLSLPRRRRSSAGQESLDSNPLEQAARPERFETPDLLVPRPRHEQVSSAVAQLKLERIDDRPRDLILDGEDVLAAGRQFHGPSTIKLLRRAPRQAKSSPS